MSELIANADHEGFRFIARLEREWFNGSNRFDGLGEVLLGAFIDERLIGIGGLNRDPYAESCKIGRIRHVFVLKMYRRGGVGEALVQKLLITAQREFHEVRLRSDTSSASNFYGRCGFDRINHSESTHCIKSPETSEII